MHDYWNRELCTGIYASPSLKYLHAPKLEIGREHQVWSTVDYDLRLVTRAGVRAKLLVGAYTLQGHRAVFNQYKVDPACRLCSCGPETRQHFILECSALDAVRKPYLETITSWCADQGMVTAEDGIPLMQLLLDGSADDATGSNDHAAIERGSQLPVELQQMSSNMMYVLHCHSALLISDQYG